MEASGDDSTTSAADAVIEPDLAPIVDIPEDWPVAMPPCEIVATWVLEVDHVTNWFIDSEIPSLKLPTALY